MRALLYLVLLGLAVAAVVWAADKWSHSRQLGRPPEPPAIPPVDQPYAERAVLLTGAEQGPGVLRVTPSQLVFTLDSGRVVVLERADIVGVAATRELPDRTVAAAVLAVTSLTSAHYFQVATPQEWERRLV